ncbi:MAG: DUF499 domain-containing protein [Sandaracinaceae bacterium]|nr:DUF499 domain-containing protein [Sandaracinaceae bacterium]
MSNRERVQKGIGHLTEGLRPFVERELKAQLGGYWIEQVKGRVRVQIDRDGSVHWDTQGLLKAMVDFWREVFMKTLGHYERSLVGELIEIRNQWAHERAFSSDDTYRALDSMERLLRGISAGPQADELAKLKTELQRTVFAEQARQQTRSQLQIEGSPKAGLKPWRLVVTPHPDVSSGRYVQAEFAADLAQVHRGEGSDEYRDPVEFFRRTFVTSGLEELLGGALLRLAGQGGDPVVELQTNFGGGKTHSMLALYHAFGGTKSASLPGLEAVLKKVGVEAAAKAKRAVLVGTAMSPAEVSQKPDGTKVHTMWGELAWQLGGKKGYALVAESDKKATAPGSDTFKALFQQVGPSLVLIDEWVAYARQTVERDGLPGGRFEVQTSFAQSLTEAARAVPGVLVVASIPASKIEVGGDHGELALEMLKNVFERVGKAWRPATGDEGFEIVRRRLFEPIADKESFAARDAIIEAFAKMYRESPQEFPPGSAEGAYRRELEAAYPIHPELFRRLYDDWSSLDKFQRTRGVLRLLANVIHRLWESQDSGLLILPSSIPLDDPGVRSEVTRYLDDHWEPIIDQDIDGPHSLPLELDRAAPNLGRYSACRRVTRSLYVGTAPGASGKNPGIDDRAVRLACAQPGEAIATFGDALRRVSDRARHIHQDGSRYWVSPKPNLNRLAEDRAGILSREPERLYEEITKRLRADKDKGEFVRVHVCPEGSADVDDEPVARLVVLPPRATHRKEQADSEGRKLAQEILESRGAGPRIYRNTLVFVAPDKGALDDLLQATAQYLAWQAILDDYDGETLNLDKTQKKQADTRRDAASDTVRLRIGATWIHHLVPTQPAATSEIVWDEMRITTSESLARRASAKLKDAEAIMPILGGPRLRMAMDRYNLWTAEPHVAFSTLAEYFAKYLYLPRVVSRDVIAKAIENGVAQLHISDTFAVASGFDETTKRYKGLKKGGAAGYVVDNQTLVVHPDAAEAQAPTLPPPVGTGTGTGPTGSGGGTTGGGTTGQPTGPSLPTTFIASARLDTLRIGRDAGRIAEEVIQHLSTIAGAEVEVSLEIHVHVAGGVQDDVVRTVTENCNTLKFKTHRFE